MVDMSNSQITSACSFASTIIVLVKLPQQNVRQIDGLPCIDSMIYCALTNLPNQMHSFNITCLLIQLRLHRLAVHVDALLGRGPVGHVAPRGPQRRLLQVRLRGQVLQVDPRAPRHRVSNMEFVTQYFVSPRYRASILSVFRLGIL